MKRRKMIVGLIVCSVLFTGCVDKKNDNDTSVVTGTENLESGTESAIITLSGDTATCSSNAVEISGSTITITDEGTYIVSGALDDGMIIVNTDKEDKTQIVLDNATINSNTSAAIYVLQSDKVFITTAEGSVNNLSNGGMFEAIDDNDIDSVIFSKEDLSLNGEGVLRVTSPAGHGIVSKDSLTITGGAYDINCASHALDGKDDVCIADGTFTIVSGKDGIHAENSDDTSLGFVYIENGEFDISAEGDGISAGAYMQIEDGVFNIVAGGGSVNGSSQSSESWGDFMGGGPHGQSGGMMGEPPGGMMGDTVGDMPSGNAGEEASADSEKSTSMKGIKAETSLVVNGGTFFIDSADDALHSNVSLTINAGVMDIASGDDALHAEEELTIVDGEINISESYEGLEGLDILISGGNISIVATDDGLNAAGGVDLSGTGGRDEMGGPGMMPSSDGSIIISGGDIYINASGDGIDANGYIEITGGYTVVCGPTMGDTATLDYDTTATISGGIFIGTGASGMAQTFSESPQGVIAVSVGNRDAKTQIMLCDANGNELVSYAPELSYAVVILSSPDIITGETYTITVGVDSAEFVAE